MTFKKGDPNINRNGRPIKENAWSDIYNRILDSTNIDLELISKEGKKNKITLHNQYTMRYALGVSMLHSALKGNVLAAKELADRTIGKAPQAVDITSDGEKIASPVIYIPDNGRNPKD